jgi:GLPGLI family protein
MKTLTFISLLFISAFTFAQGVEGVITYEFKINNHRRIPAEREAMKNMIPEYSTFKFLLPFNQNESLYKPSDEDDDVTMESGGMRMTMKNPQNETYLDQSTLKRVRMREFMGKNYLTEDTLTMHPWKIAAETKMIHGYKCRQAYYESETETGKQTVVAWFTDQLRPYLGPESYNTLPGAILEVDINEGERVYKVSKLDLRGLKKNELKQPSKGQKVSEKEYQALVEEQMTKMRANGGMIIRN